MYRIASNKRRGRSFNSWHFWGGRLFKGGVYTREAFITKYRKVTILYINVNDFVVFFYPALSASSTFESMNGLGRLDSSNTSSCDINCSLPFWQGAPSLKQWTMNQTSRRRVVLITFVFISYVHSRGRSFPLKKMRGGGGGGRLFEGGVYKKIW